jgi:hypothetical protein
MSGMALEEGGQVLAAVVRSLWGVVQQVGGAGDGEGR